MREAGHNLVLAETANFNFDTSDFVGSGTPQVFATINGKAYGFTDELGVLFGNNDSVGSLETSPYQLIGSVEIPTTVVPVPGAALLMGSGVAAFAAVGRRRRAA